MRPLTSNVDYDFQPSISPDGTRIAYVSKAGDESGINTINKDCSVLTNVTVSSANIGDIIWSPDGEWLLFAAEQDDDWDTYLINIDGSNQQNLTDNPADDMDPEWIP